MGHVSSRLMAKCSESSEGGWDYEFIETPPDSLVCKICHYPSKEPHLTLCCGHTFCSSCLKNAKKSTALTDACPMCRSNQFTTVPNKQNERAVLSLKVTCSNTNEGCEWVGEVNDIASHLRDDDGCEFEKVSCSNDCGKTLERRYLADHVTKECRHRLVNCQYCAIVGKLHYIEGTHKQQCYKHPAPCPNKCEIQNVPSKHLKEHMKVCPLEVVKCQFHDMGCKVKMARKDLVKHDEEKTSEHLSLMKAAFVDTQNKLSDTQGKLVETQSKLVDTQNKLADTQRKLESTQSRLGNVKHRLDDTEDKLCDIEERLEATELEILENHTGVLDEVGEARAHNDRELTAMKDRIDELEATLKQKTKLVDMLFEKWSIKIHTRAAKMSSCNQLLPVIIKMPDFFMNMKNKFEWNSDPFYTHHEGYKMMLTVVPTGRGSSEGHYMSVYLYIMDGPFDHLLKWKMKGKFQVMLLNQTSDNLHYSTSYRVHADSGQSRPFWYSDEFVSHKELREKTINCEYVKDDCVFFEVCEL